MIDLGGRSFRLHRPGRSYETILAESLDEGRFPWWPLAYPGSVALGSYLLQRAPLRGRAIELGCGLGLAGIAGAAAGLRVTLTDLEPEALELARRSARDNDVLIESHRALDWNTPGWNPRYDMVLGADILHEPADFGRMLTLFDALLEDGGQVLLADPGRELGRTFYPAAREAYRIRSEVVTIRLHEATSAVEVHELTRR